MSNVEILDGLQTVTQGYIIYDLGNLWTQCDLKESVVGIVSLLVKLIMNVLPNINPHSLVKEAAQPIGNTYSWAEEKATGQLQGRAPVAYSKLMSPYVYRASFLFSSSSI